MSSRSNTTCCRYLFLGVDLNDLKDICVERLGSLISTSLAKRVRGQAFAAGRNDVRRDVLCAQVGGHAQVFDRCISTMSNPGIHDPTAIIAVIIRRRYPPHGVPVARREVRFKRSKRSCWTVFQVRDVRAAVLRSGASAASRSASSKISERLIDVAFYRGNADLSPLGFEALLRGPMATRVTTAPSRLSRCTAST